MANQDTGDNERMPCLRGLDARPGAWEGQRGIVLQDPLGLVEGAIFVPEHLVPVFARLDGLHTLAAIEREFESSGDPLPSGFLADLVRQLDESLLLEGELLRTTIERTATAFLAERTRRAAHAGSQGYPGDRDRCRATLDAMLGALPDPTGSPLRGLVAPHIDLSRGHAAYRVAYRRLAARELPDLFVVLGTGHGGPSAPLTGLPLDWDTPLGCLRTDRGFIARVHSRIGAPAAADLLLHRGEHSLEFQMLMLAHLCGGAEIEVAGFLCGSLPTGSGDPDAESYVTAIVAALTESAQEAGRSVTFLAGADLAHVGPTFGDVEPLDSSALAALAQRDRARLRLLESGQAGRFHAAITAGGNPDRVCSATAMYLCARLAGGNAEILHYEQATAADGSECVSFCGAAFA